MLHPGPHRIAADSKAGHINSGALGSSPEFVSSAVIAGWERRAVDRSCEISYYRSLRSLGLLAILGVYLPEVACQPPVFYCLSPAVREKAGIDLDHPICHVSEADR